MSSPDDELAELCDRYGLPHDVTVLHRHLVNNAQAVYGAKDYVIRVLQARLEVATTALAAIGEARCLDHDHHPRGSPTCPNMMSHAYAREALAAVAAVHGYEGS